MTMLFVVLAILQVDFPAIFDRALCKTEESNISLMDVGVALITLNSGMSCRKARPWFSVKGLKAQLSDFIVGVQENIVTVCAGTFRFLLLSELDY